MLTNDQIQQPLKRNELLIKQQSKMMSSFMNHSFKAPSDQSDWIDDMSDTDTNHSFDETSVEIQTDATESDALDHLISDCPTPDNREEKNILTELDEFFTGKDEVGPEINSDLAKGLTSAFHTRVGEEKDKALMKGHKRSKNCDNWTVPRNNESVWPSLKRNLKMWILNCRRFKGYS